MSTEDILRSIRHRCVELLAIAEKRTQGEWVVSSSIMVCSKEAKLLAQCNDFSGIGVSIKESADNSSFIASCAGPAEAGWRATIAAIDHLLCGWMDSKSGDDLLADAIIAAWEGQI